MSERRELTEEERQNLAGFLPFSKDATIDFIPASFLQKSAAGEYVVPEGYRPIFTLRTMNKEMYDKTVKIQIEMGQGVPLIQKQAAIRDIVKSCIVGWSDFIDIGKTPPEEIKHEDTEYKTNMIPWPVVLEIFMFLLKISGLLPGEKLGLK